MLIGINMNSGSVVVRCTKPVEDGMPSNLVVFTQNGTYVPPANLVSAIVECIGGGGAGGWTTALPINSEASFAGGGGGGSYARSVLSAAHIGGSQAVTVGGGGVATTGSAGAGGTTSFGSLVSAPGGQGAGFAASSSPIARASGGAFVPGAGGIRGIGQLTFPGNKGGTPIYNWIELEGQIDLSIWSGEGGLAPFGGGFQGIAYNWPPSDNSPQIGMAQPGVSAAPNTGAGGSGSTANTYNTSTPAVPGGNGGSGVCIITEFTSA